MGTLLAVKDLVVNYGAVQALKGVTLELGDRDIVAVLGANGAGKTTLLKSISHIQPVRSGSVLFNGTDLATVPAFRLAELGIAHVPEGRQVFSTLTTEENLNVGAYGVRNQPAGKQLAKTKDWVFDLFPILKERRKQLAGTLSGGEQQMLAIGRGLISKPRVLLLDEPSLGLAPIIVQEIFRVIRQIHEEEGVSILLVEQNARKALGVARFGYILELGKVAIEGEACDLKNDERVRAAYLGGSKVSC
ncbi:MAG: ABC transporter ATP-binding protein [Candidatus Cryosericum sp.]|nr:ABC transporter ATP-binding protein [Candidatus Cryosericum sp.]HPS70418.1 ABC transporter ATP-binding protein [Candidatus Cryosericum sp.]